MSNLERRPEERTCGGKSTQSASPLPTLLEPREVPLGGPRAMTVRRTLPHKQIRTIGAWCFVDHYGPNRQTMAVPPHPHIGLQTVSWLISGDVEHRDSLGSHQRIRPGELNVMTAGRGIAHSEYSVGDEQVPLHGVQLWVALTDEHRDQAPSFEHHASLPVVSDHGFTAIVMTGELAGAVSSATTFSPLFSAEVRLDSSSRVQLPVERDFEYAVLALDARDTVNGSTVPHGNLQYLGWGNSQVELRSEAGVRLMVLGGEPLAEELLMWWNFVGRDHEEIVAARDQWQSGDSRFGDVHGDDNARLPAPPMPTTKLKPRASRP